jgi:hypothetical protein
MYEKEEPKAFRNVGLAAVAPLSASLTSNAYSEPEQHAQTAKKKTGIDAGFAVLPCGGLQKRGNVCYLQKTRQQEQRSYSLR